MRGFIREIFADAAYLGKVFLVFAVVALALAGVLFAGDTLIDVKYREPQREAVHNEIRAFLRSYYGEPGYYEGAKLDAYVVAWIRVYCGSEFCSEDSLIRYGSEAESSVYFLARFYQWRAEREGGAER